MAETPPSEPAVVSDPLVEPDPEPDAPPVVVELVDADDAAASSDPHPASATRPAPAISLSARRRWMRVDRSNARPRSWLCSSSSSRRSLAMPFLVIGGPGDQAS